MKSKVERQRQEQRAARRRITNKVRRSVFKRWTIILCAYCGSILTPESATGDHVQPVSKGGKNKRRNIVIACAPCNSRKGSMDVEDFLRMLKEERSSTPLKQLPDSPVSLKG